MAYDLLGGVLDANQTEARLEFPVGPWAYARVQVEAETTALGTAVFTVKHRLCPTGAFVGFASGVTVSQTGITSIIDIRAVTSLAVEVTTLEGNDEKAKVTLALWRDD
jgi:hypothetical protein